MIHAQRREPFDSKPDCSVYVRNFPFTCTEDELKELFQSIGEVVHAYIHTGPHRQPLYSGFVMFEKAEHAVEAVNKLNQHIFQGRPIQ